MTVPCRERKTRPRHVQEDREATRTRTFTRPGLPDRIVGGGRTEVSGIIDWGEAILGPAEWDLVYLWFWTFSRDQEAMRVCLDAYFDGRRQPGSFARRSLAALFYTPSIGLLWDPFLERGVRSRDIVKEITTVLFPEEVFGAP